VATDDSKAKGDALAARLAAFGKADPYVLESYKYVVYLRATSTTEFLTKKATLVKEVEKGRSCIAKCGSLIKTLMVYAIVACFLIPILYETFNRLMNKDKSVLDADYDTVNSGFNSKGTKKQLTPEEMAQRA